METITLKRPAEALTVIPHLLGFYPTHHLVVFGAECDPQGPAASVAHSGPLMKVDLRGGPVTFETALELASGVEVCRMRRVIIAAYVEDVETISDSPHFASLAATVSMVCDRLEMMWETDSNGWSLDVFVADEHGFYDLSEDKTYRWDVLDSSEAAASLVYAGSAPLTQEPSIRIERKSKTRRQNATRTCAQQLQDGRHNRIFSTWDSLIRRFIRYRSKGRSARLPEVSSREAGLALAGLKSIEIRDRILSLALSSEPLVPLNEVDLSNSAELNAQEMPNIERARAFLMIFDEIAGFASETDPAPLACAAYLAWWIGMTSLAAQRTREALVADSTYSLAMLLNNALQWSSLPPWLSPAICDEAPDLQDDDEEAIEEYEEECEGNEAEADDDAA